MSKLTLFLNYLDKHKKELTRVSKGSDFEGSLQQALKTNGFNQVVLDTDLNLKEYVQKIKPLVHSKTESVLLENSLEEGTGKYVDFFVVEPYGTQNFPDLMVFTDSKIVMIESKFTKKKVGNPMWNSNLPKKDSFYVYGSAELNTLVFFVGNSILHENARNKLIEMEQEIVAFAESLHIEFDETIKPEENPSNFFIYPRLAFHNRGGGNMFDENEKDRLIREAKAFAKEKDL